MGSAMAEVSVTDLTWSIQHLGYQATNSHLDGYFQWGQKQKLYQILWETQRQLRKCSKFYGEEEWLADHAEQELIDKLKGY